MQEVATAVAITTGQPHPRTAALQRPQRIATQWSEPETQRRRALLQPPQAIPWPGHCNEVLYPMLTEGCDVDAALASAISADVLSRAWSFVALPDSIRNVLLASFVEEVFDHDPPEGTLQLKASVTVVVRNSLLEEAHANGPLNAGGFQAITTAACAPLSHLLAAGRRGHVDPDTDNRFAHLPTTYPRAWAALTALAETFSAGGRGAYRVPDAPTPDLPEPDELIDAPSAASDERISVLSAIDPRFDQRLLTMLEAAAYEGRVLWVSALSRISRNLDKLLRALEFLIAHNATILTTNYMIRASDVWIRRDTLVKPVSNNPNACLTDPTGLTGAHKKAYEQVAKQRPIQPRRSPRAGPETARRTSAQKTAPATTSHCFPHGIRRVVGHM